ncbi:MAG: UDP-N-acetylmuramate--L-alanine ligase, partial [Rhizobacter sp.]|nr:UDP-N-acetylmuramate--L-alanine ligase [Chlorobiales bacterium]
GKTTTTTMTGIMLKECGENPTVLIGGISDYFKGSAVVGKGEYFVIESDEYDRTFLKLTPTIAVITNLEAEHLDIYADLADIKQAFVQFANKVPFYGAVIVCSDEVNIQHILPEIHRKVITYGISSEGAPAAELQATDIHAEQSHSVFTVRFLGNELGKINLAVPGLHNVKNALAAVAVGLEIGLEFAAIKAGLEKFSAVRRRFQIKRGAEQGTMVVDDYAHHPTEVRATLEAAKSGWPDRRVVAVFQPHLFSRTKDFAEDFGEAFTDADVLVVTDVYASRENALDYEGVSGKLVADAAKKFGHKNVHYIAEKNKLPEFLKSLATKNDLVITLGAGDITKFGEAFITLLD